VHDESAAALGGVAGHAGLFSTARDLWRFTQMWLDNGEWRGDNEERPARNALSSQRASQGARLLRAETVAMATRIQTAGLRMPTQGLAFHCGLGWMIGHPVIMRDAPADTYGHTGFTGPALVLVPSRRLSVVVLSNRTYPRRGPAVHHEVTAALLRAALVEEY
jgi:CubicO group peptidase (beta-lactamase class C family)